MKYYLMTFFLLLFGSRMVYYYSTDNYRLRLYNNTFKLIDVKNENIELYISEGKVKYNKDTIICIDTFRKYKFVFQKTGKNLKVIEWDYFRYEGDSLLKKGQELILYNSINIKADLNK